MSSTSPAEPPRRASASGTSPQHWIERHGDALYRYARLHLDDRETAEEAVQETFVSALASLDTFAHRSSERTWLIGILRHKIFDHYRRRRRRAATDVATGERAARSLFDEDGHWKRPPANWAVAGADLLDREEFTQVLRGCLGRLDPALRDAFFLRELYGLAPDRIRAIFGLSSTNLSTRLYRARALLRTCLERHWFESEGKD